MNRIALLESARVGADALRANPTRTLLSTTGVVIGVAALVAAFAITDGVYVWSRDLIARESSVQDVAISPLASMTINGRRYAVRGYPVFTEEDAAAAAAEVPGAVGEALTLSGETGVEYLGHRASVLLTVSTAGLADFSGLVVAGGRFYTSPEVNHHAAVIVLGHKLAEELAGTRDPLWLIGQTVKVRGERREVIGVLASPVGGERDFVAFAPFRDASTLFAAAAAPLLPKLRLKARSIEAVDTLRSATVDWLAQRYGRAIGKLQVVVNTQQLENTRQGILLTKLLLGMLVSLILVVGGTGIMNVFLAAVTERTREIGIRKAVGARARDIEAQFLVESVTVTGVGAAIGFVAGLALAFGGTALFRYYLGSEIHPVVKVQTALLAMCSAVAVGLVFGTYPARLAARLSPVDAIARE